MIIINVITSNNKWYNYIKDPINYVSRKVKKLNKKERSIQKTLELTKRWLHKIIFFKFIFAFSRRGICLLQKNKTNVKKFNFLLNRKVYKLNMTLLT